MYGPGDRQLLPRLLRLARDGRILSPGDLRVSSALTYAGNLAEAVQRSLDYAEKKAGGTYIFNVADTETYELRGVVCRLLSAVYAQELPVLEMPLPALKLLAGVLEHLPVASSFTRFSLETVSQPSVLSLDKIKTELSYQPAVNFWEVLPDIQAWVERTGLVAVRAGQADLPWAP